MNIVLASTSKIRGTLLANAGIEFTAVAPDVDETIIKKKHDDLAPEQLAGLLAEAKCLNISKLWPNAMVIGADQVLAKGDRIYDKPASLDEARKQLLSLRGDTHRLISAICCANNEHIVWRHTTPAILQMRDFSDRFLDLYLRGVGEDAMTSVGAYKLEGPGIQLFDALEGDYFTILGLPMLPLLGFLRQEGLIAT